MDATEALEQLKLGNARYTANQLTLDVTDSDRMRVARGQNPFAVILGCSDSRVPLEVVFDQGLGELFVIRIAGNVVEQSQIGSVEFAAQTFGTRLVVVLGHTHCGAVEATIDALEHANDAQSPNLAAIVDRIKPAVKQLLDESLSRDELMQRAVHANVRHAAEMLRHGSTIIEELVARDALTIVGACYALETGIVEFFDAANT